MTNAQGWHSVLGVDLSSLQVLDITGNITWNIPEEILKLPKLREINGVDMSPRCSTCSLMKNQDDADDFTSIIYLPEQGYRLRNVCVEQELTLHWKYRRFPTNRFLPRCIINNDVCRTEFGIFKTRNRCLDLGAPILLAFTFIAVLSIAANILVLVVISVRERLRKKPAMMLAGTLAIGDILLSIYTISMGIIYQVMTPENFQSTLDQVCPYLGSLIIAGFALGSHVSFLMTLEKYLVIVYSLKPHLHMRTKTTMRYICLAVVVSLIPALMMFFSPQLYEGKGNCLPMFGRETTKGTVFGLSTMVTYTFLYLGTFVLYLRIFFAASQSGSRMGIHREGQLVKRIGVIIGTNIALGFGPFVFVFAASSFVRQGIIDYDLWIVFGITLPIGLSTLNALIDPFLYAYRNPQFKIFLKQKWDQIRPKKTTEESPDENVENIAEAVVIVNFRHISA